MITSDEQLNQAVEQMGRMYRALAALRREVLPLSEKQFALMAEGPLDEIRRLEEGINAYTGKDTAEASDADVWLRITGPTLGWPEAPTSIVTALLDSLRKGVQAIAAFSSTGHLTTRSTKELKHACDLRIVAFQPGSLRVGVRLPDEGLMEWIEESEPAPIKALRQYLEVAGWVGSDDPATALEQLIPDPQQRRVVLNALKPFVPRPRGDVDRIELSGRAVPRGSKIQLTRRANGRIDQAIDRIEAEQVEEHEGDLR
jgi:hypothetical protein